jgi:importin subunit alpha-6/7
MLAGDELLDALWAIANNSEGQKSRIQRIIEVPAFPPKLLALCSSGDIEVQVPCLRVIGNISTGNEGQTEVLLRLDVLKLIEGLLEHEKKSIRREACWILSNICAGSKRQIAQVLARPTLLYRVALLFTSDHNDVKKEVCYVFANMCHLGDVKAVYAVVLELKVI